MACKAGSVMGTINGSGMSRHRIQAPGYASVRKAELTRALPDRAQLCFTLKPKRLRSCKTPWEVVKRQEEILAQLLGQTPGTKGDQDEKRLPPAMHWQVRSKCALHSEQCNEGQEERGSGADGTTTHQRLLGRCCSYQDKWLCMNFKQQNKDCE